MFALIAAIGQQGQLGLNGGLPWGELKEDRRWFKALTMASQPVERATDWFPPAGFGMSVTPKDLLLSTNNAVIMGRRTWESLPGPLVGRENIVLHAAGKGEQADLQECADLRGCLRDCLCAHTLQQAIHTAQVLMDAPHTFIIGGAEVYAEALRLPDLAALFLTEVQYHGKADTYLRGMDWVEGWFTEKGQTWHRTHVCPWITEPDRPAYRFGIWEKDI